MVGIFHCPIRTNIELGYNAAVVEGVVESIVVVIMNKMGFTQVSVTMFMPAIQIMDMQLRSLRAQQR